MLYSHCWTSCWVQTSASKPQPPVFAVVVWPMSYVILHMCTTHMVIIDLVLLRINYHDTISTIDIIGVAILSHNPKIMKVSSKNDNTIYNFSQWKHRPMLASSSCINIPTIVCCRSCLCTNVWTSTLIYPVVLVINKSDSQSWSRSASRENSNKTFILHLTVHMRL